MKTLVSRFTRQESGATAFEPGPIAADIVIAKTDAVSGGGTTISTTLTTISSSLQ
jgi:pilus assembly protein Flp/PilA